MPRVSSTRRPVSVLLAAALITGGLAARARADGLLHHHEPPPVPCRPCYTLYQAGPEPAALQVRIVGAGYDTLEVYSDDRLGRVSIPGVNLCQCGQILLSENRPDVQSDNFAVRYGWYGFAAFGWSGGQLVAVTGGVAGETPPIAGVTPQMHLSFEPGCAIDATWVTPRIVRVAHGARGDQVTILRFDGGATGWRVLYQGAVSGASGY